MKLACEGSDFVAEGETADAVHAAMMAHGDEAHSNHCRCSPSVEYPILNIRYSIFIYSYRNARIGSTRDALSAGM